MCRTLRLLVVFGCCAALLACTSMQSAARGPEAVNRLIAQADAPLRVGERVRLTRTDGSVLLMEVTLVETHAIGGLVDGSSESLRVPTTDIDHLERVRFDGGNTVAAVGVGLLVFVVLLANALRGAFDGMRFVPAK